VLSAQPFQTPIDFAYFDLWHYYGRTSKHGAFIGGAEPAARIACSRTLAWAWKEGDPSTA
jgi:hypothetical protein